MTPEQAAAVAKIRDAIDNQPAHKAQRDDPVPVKADDLRTILAALDAAQAAATHAGDCLEAAQAHIAALEAECALHQEVAAKSVERADHFQMAENRAELLAEDIEAFHKCMDDAGVPSTYEGKILSMFGRAIRFRFAAQAAAQAPREAPRLTDDAIEKLREATFSTGNPFCPVDDRSMRKAARAVEARVRELCGVAP